MRFEPIYVWALKWEQLKNIEAAWWEEKLLLSIWKNDINLCVYEGDEAPYWMMELVYANFDKYETVEWTPAHVIAKYRKRILKRNPGEHRNKKSFVQNNF